MHAQGWPIFLCTPDEEDLTARSRLPMKHSTCYRAHNACISSEHLVDLHVGRLLIDMRPLRRRCIALEHVQQLVAPIAILKHLGSVLQHTGGSVRSAGWWNAGVSGLRHARCVSKGWIAWGLTPRLSGVSQICRNRVVSAVCSFISECTMPLPALRYCTLPRPRASCLIVAVSVCSTTCRPDEQSKPADNPQVRDSILSMDTCWVR